MAVTPHTLDEMIRELKTLGWRQWINPTTGQPSGALIWECPNGRIYRGPALAWHIATGREWPPKNDGDLTNPPS